MGYHLWNSHCFPCCRMFKQCNLPNSKKVGSHPVGKDGLWNKNKKTILVSFLNFYQANGNKIESERAQQLAGSQGSQAHSCNRVRRYPSPQNDIFLNKLLNFPPKKWGGEAWAHQPPPPPPTHTHTHTHTHTRTIPMAIAMNSKHQMGNRAAPWGNWHTPPTRRCKYHLILKLAISVLV